MLYLAPLPPGPPILVDGALLPLAPAPPPPPPPLAELPPPGLPHPEFGETTSIPLG